MTRVPASQATCPHCGAKLRRVPTRKRRCPSCKQVIVVRRGLDGTDYAVTEDEVKVISRERRKHNESKRGWRPGEEEHTRSRPVAAYPPNEFLKKALVIFLVGLIVVIASGVIRYMMESPPAYESPQPQQSTESTPAYESPQVQQSEALNAYITGRDWIEMTQTQKREWVRVALLAMQLGGQLKKSETLPVDYYVQKLDQVLLKAGSAGKLAAL